MPDVEIIFPGVPSDYTYHDPDTGEDVQMVEWTFSAVIDGESQTVSGVFSPTVSQDRAAYWIRDSYMLGPDHSANAGAVGISGGSAGGGDSGGGVPGISGGGGVGSGSILFPNEKMKTKDGT